MLGNLELAAQIRRAALVASAAGIVGLAIGVGLIAFRLCATEAAARAQADPCALVPMAHRLYA